MLKFNSNGGLMMKKIMVMLLLVVVMIFIGCSSGQELLADQNLKKLVSREVGTAPEELKVEDLKQIKNLRINDQSALGLGDIKSLTGIKHLSQLKALNLKDNKIKDITPLQNLTELKYLNLSNNQIEDIKPVTKLDKLMYLHISNNNFDISSGSETMQVIKKLRKKGIKVKY